MRYGEGYIFGTNLNKEYGYDKVEELMQEGKQIIKQTDQDLIDLINKYQILVEKRKKELSLQ